MDNPYVFISYSTEDSEFAEFLYRHLENEDLNVFLAGVSLSPGGRWSPETLSALDASTWVLFLASKQACESMYVQQEVGGAILKKKRLIPIVWDMSPSELPGWSNQVQALDLNGATAESIQKRFSELAKEIRADRVKGQVIGGLLLAGLVYLATRS